MDVKQDNLVTDLAALFSWTGSEWIRYFSQPPQSWIRYQIVDITMPLATISLVEKSALEDNMLNPFILLLSCLMVDWSLDRMCCLHLFYKQEVPQPVGLHILGISEY